ncbi:hypothetical protein AAF463_24050 (plasmid) [Pantoea sp. BJ2]|uniref:Uncharacterized protein n=1 Tax=Pantoea sp. BJ2 TaxID=3141322 RepID=A0AAU7U3Y5_9GAMM
MLDATYYYVCPWANGGGMLHAKGCPVLDEKRERIFIGTLYTHLQAMAVAKLYLKDTTRCPFCTSQLSDAHDNRAVRH